MSPAFTPRLRGSLPRPTGGEAAGLPARPGQGKRFLCLFVGSLRAPSPSLHKQNTTCSRGLRSKLEQTGHPKNVERSRQVSNGFRSHKDSVHSPEALACKAATYPTTGSTISGRRPRVLEGRFSAWGAWVGAFRQDACNQDRGCSRALAFVKSVLVLRRGRSFGTGEPGWTASSELARQRSRDGFSACVNVCKRLVCVCVD